MSPKPRGPTGRRTSKSDTRTTGGTTGAAARGIAPLVDAILEMLDVTKHLAVKSAAVNSIALFVQTWLRSH